jgi:hypothetical protein
MDTKGMMDYMREKGIGSVMVRFTGSGDEGYLDEIVVWDVNGNEMVDGDNEAKTFREACVTRCQDAIDELASGFCDNEGGAVEWKLDANGDVSVLVQYNEVVSYPAVEFTGRVDDEGQEWQKRAIPIMDSERERLSRAYAMLGETARALIEVAQGRYDKDLSGRIDELMQRVAREFPDLVGDDYLQATKGAKDGSNDACLPDLH